MQHAVFVVFQHVEHITFTTLLCYLAACRQRFVFGVLQFFLQFVQLDDIVLDIVSVGDIVEVVILSVDAVRNRIALSLKQVPKVTGA